MTKELIEEFRRIVIPYMVNRFKEINYEGQGDSDAEEFKSNFDEICDLAIKALEQEPKRGHWIKGYTYPDGEYWKCDKCNELIKVKYPMHYCNNCGSDNREVEEV